MVQVYYKLIKSGKLTLDKVPERWHDAVKALLDSDEGE
jgi:hypothetical protein